MIYIVIEWDNYYPSPDNSVAAFSSRESAVQFMESYQTNYDYLDIITLEVKD